MTDLCTRLARAICEADGKTRCFCANDAMCTKALVIIDAAAHAVIARYPEHRDQDAAAREILRLRSWLRALEYRSPDSVRAALSGEAAPERV